MRGVPRSNDTSIFHDDDSIGNADPIEMWCKPQSGSDSGDVPSNTGSG